eukprot:1158072-Pelagomonas_calceolata.AAC.2
MTCSLPHTYSCVHRSWFESVRRSCGRENVRRSSHSCDRARTGTGARLQGGGALELATTV